MPRNVAIFLAATLILAGCAPPNPPAPPANAPPPPGAALPAVALDEPAAGQAPLTGWAQGLTGDLEISVAALRAYGYAGARIAAEDPGCGLGWSTLAGIGSVETAHGRFGGSRLDAQARPQPPIRGAALDGSEGVAEILDTDGGALDGDATYDRAVGPLQFIPGTWAQWGADADGDGVADPDDLDDAALAAARYLCASGGDLATARGWSTAVLTYNRSRAYVQEVLDRAAAYAAGRAP